MGLLVNVTSSSELSFMEFSEISDYISSRVSSSAMVKTGWVVNEAMGDEVQVTVIATGFNNPVHNTPVSHGASLQQHLQGQSPKEKVLPYEEWSGLFDGRKSGREEKKDQLDSLRSKGSLSGSQELDLQIPTFLRERRI
jgi:cell division GTPase FtsZ